MRVNQPTMTALESLHESLGDRAKLLDYLPFEKVQTQNQGEIPLAIPKAILIGTGTAKGLAHKRPLVWAYLCRRSFSLVFHTYHQDGQPGGVLITDEVRVSAYNFLVLI
jgi:hypothetical protein